MVELRNVAIGTLTMLLLLSMGYIVYPEDTHFCRVLEIAKECNRLSSTEKTCYPLPLTRTGSKYCSSGWEEIQIIPDPIIVPEPEPIPEPKIIIEQIDYTAKGKQYKCDTKECWRIN